MTHGTPPRPRPTPPPRPKDVEMRENIKESGGKSLIVIPARMASKRLPGKPLLMAGGQALVHWTYAQAKRTKADHVVVATPDREIARYCQENAITWMATAEDHPNGTSRCWEIVERSKVDFDVIVNWQCDEPCMRTDVVDYMIDVMNEENIFREIWTFVCSEELSTEQLFDQNLTKTVYSDDMGRCHWFSRAPMRGASAHVGIYGIPSLLLSVIGKRKAASKYAKAEGLEQLAWLEHGDTIRCIEVDKVPLSINTQSDWEKFKQLVKEDSKCP